MLTKKGKSFKMVVEAEKFTSNVTQLTTLQKASNFEKNIDLDITPQTTIFILRRVMLSFHVLVISSICLVVGTGLQAKAGRNWN